MKNSSKREGTQWVMASWVHPDDASARYRLYYTMEEFVGEYMGTRVVYPACSSLALFEKAESRDYNTGPSDNHAFAGFGCHMHY